jgi:ABC-type phosphate transport system substrate-binding protein
MTKRAPASNIARVRPLRSASAIACGVLAFGAAACGGDDNPAKVSGTLNGSGSTFAAPIYQQVGSDLQGRGLTVNYQPVGSGAGISQLEARTVDFAGSDPALAPEDRQKIGDPIQVPFALGAITVSYNVPNLESGVKLDGRTIADIYLGRIKSWDEPAIAEQNPGVTLPATKITVVHRSRPDPQAPEVQGPGGDRRHALRRSRDRELMWRSPRRASSRRGRRSGRTRSSARS